ncbi:TrkH family potassium uptake protein [Rhodovulum sulfidophilum]|uniref:TrkH family potassium uptake protein n=1 Tax=Rhodovulum sulfidophilum TaxID=35806 RepID=UPI000A603A4F|nr:TrkH family potassium uptake protein [Rhodovulum sulfidophilum]MBL3584983.1 Ktr system potassium transporter B [Rhodovulum sulfidophilum]MCE8419563.1 TrkH family potassium uptake protein [Rhodovulum sulfidophilum]MCE8440440.1 TrkH family potassium uptake protein [Rhodovulum sulfidophilum]NDK33873.1 Ktr system potassium transporter B [Rhodovulum sulfidophilum]
MAPFAALRSGRFLPPPLALMLIYAALIAAGTLLLKLPVARTVAMSWSDLAFTATSAVTVTGLAVRDTGSEFTLFGQAVILVLIQLGGLGLMTFAVLILTMLGLPVGITHRQYLREDLNQTSMSGLIRLTRTILRFVLVCEAAGAALLAVVFVPEFGWGAGLWASLFHAVSAFNNAGFALYPDSLSAWVGHPVVNLTVPALLILGGLGFTVIADMQRRTGWRGYTVHTKLMLVGTLALLVWSTASFAALEWHNPATLGQFDRLSTRLWASWFQAATTRTAGFNTVDIGGLTQATTLIFMTLMVVGAGSTSTGGGIKVTTFIMLLLATYSFFRRHTAIDVFGRRLGAEQIMKVLALSMVSMLTVLVALFVLMLFHEGDFLDIAFETVSAFGTVGLSRGITGDLDTGGRAVLMLVMFLGRVGPLTLGFLLAVRHPRRVSYPAGTVYLG